MRWASFDDPLVVASHRTCRYCKNIEDFIARSHHISVHNFDRTKHELRRTRLDLLVHLRRTESQMFLHSLREPNSSLFNSLTVFHDTCTHVFIHSHKKCLRHLVAKGSHVRSRWFVDITWERSWRHSHTHSWLRAIFHDTCTHLLPSSNRWRKKIKKWFSSWTEKPERSH